MKLKRCTKYYQSWKKFITVLIYKPLIQMKYDINLYIKELLKLCQRIRITHLT